jgi:hypothetical protein
MQVSEFLRPFARNTTNQNLLERFSFTKWSVGNRQLAVIDILERFDQWPHFGPRDWSDLTATKPVNVGSHQAKQSACP